MKKNMQQQRKKKKKDGDEKSRTSSLLEGIGTGVGGTARGDRSVRKTWE